MKGAYTELSGNRAIDKLVAKAVLLVLFPSLDEDTTNYDAFKEWVGEVPRAAKGAAGKRRRGGGDDDDLGARSGRKVGNKRQKGNKGAGWGRGASKGTTRVQASIPNDGK
ncbi:hypothetical protein VOLCADRAFT_97900 [Volvox carteri f. nagariensis]|uniref:Uncharacterized protein n=1 Tax=Volvox carteri f. nagariensis TaxID=3068 RepID=D8UDY1_VOLCA|nr:uncharacterized protein VOLCADRAFT_97900 [Volvox carteri f. nagariensis]EFJ41992.1 hypothetical protein VOLCADRAFT_97900 [Volvox carteri f. nagariensis]|eukprot:XP_002956867.1 hypothetical protein VOLCADRAFT_97900 [Volvox carteri f. nagariensis]